MTKSPVAILLLMAAGVATATQNIPNPVIPNVADIGVLKYNGKYYLGGCRTDGDFYISSDLVDWHGPVHVIDMDNNWSRGTGCGNNQIHSNDMVYDNGTVHAYWSVNYWGQDINAVHVVHSEASDPMGPYAEPDKDRWMDNRIDPKVFRDDDGSLYMYMVRFTDGNAIWARKMKNYREFENDPDNPGDGFVCQFASSPHTWERSDNVVAEGPWVIKYHGKYYMMYNANHSGGEWGNYQLGVAVASHPLGFNNANKYNHPVAESNQKHIADDYPDVLLLGTGKYTPDWEYTTVSPGLAWLDPGFETSSWKKGKAGFSREHIGGSTTYRKGTHWDTDSIWLHKTFTISDPECNYALRVTHRGPTMVYINGQPVYGKEEGDYCIVNLTRSQKKLLHEGENIISAESVANPNRGGYFNAELFRLGDDIADPEIVCTPGQPNILRGPNGFEWWLIYMANHRDKSRDQYVDRVHFFGDKLTVDGISHRNNGGFHPVPALPAYGETFDTNPDLSKWEMLDTINWKTADGEMTAVNPGQATLNKLMGAESYLWEANIKPQGNSGIYAVWYGPDSYVRIGFSKDENCLVVEECIAGNKNTLRRPLREDFRWGVYHQLRIERDGRDIILSVDGMRDSRPIEISFQGIAVPGIYAESASTAFDGLVYTIGFDDGNDRMNGWTIHSGNLDMTSRGAKANGTLTATKGAPSKSYEFTTQVSGLGNDAVAGFFPLYVDSKNYVKAVLNAATHTIDIAVVRKGKVNQNLSVPLECMRTLYTDSKYSDNIEKGYLMDCPTTFDAMRIKRFDFENPDIFEDDMFRFHRPAYLSENGKWVELDVSESSVADHPAFTEAHFEPVTAKRLSLPNKDGDTRRHIYEIRIHELFKDSYNLRVVREDSRLHILVDGKEVADLQCKFPASAIGLVSENGTPEFHGVMYYHK